MTAGTVKKSPVIVVKKKRQIMSVTENVPATPDREKTVPVVNDAAGLKPQPHPSGLTAKRRPATAAAPPCHAKCAISALRKRTTFTGNPSGHDAERQTNQQGGPYETHHHLLHVYLPGRLRHSQS
ncbi:TPA: hypothetical protein ACIPAK_003704 [Salmonella enterica subsp. enterica serovar Aberdeen]